MKSMTERLALGELGLEGRFELVVTNPLTGRVHQRVQDKNVVCDGLYAYLRNLCAGALASYDMASGSPRGPLSRCDLFSGNLSGAGSYLGGAVPCLSLTDGTAPEQKGRCFLDGTVVAAGTASTTAASGTIYGAFNPTASRQSTGGVYRRWDWASTNGNGAMSKISLHLNRQRGLILTGEGSMSGGGCALEGTCMGVAGDEIWYVTGVTGASTSNQTLHVRKYRLEGQALTASDVDINLISGGCCPQEDFFHVYQRPSDANTVYLFPLATGLLYREYYVYYTYNRQSGAVTKFGPFQAKGHTITEYSTGNMERGILFAYVDDTGVAYVFSGCENTLFRLNQGDLTASAAGACGRLFSNLQGKQRLFQLDGKQLYILSAGAGSAVVTLGETLSCMELVWKPFGAPGDVIPFRMGDGTYRLFCYGSNYTQIEPANSIASPIYLMTEKLLPQPVVKQDMTMYVGYTLQFV